MGEGALVGDNPPALAGTSRLWRGLAVSGARPAGRRPAARPGERAERYARKANDTRGQDINNKFLDGRRELLQAYYDRTGADAIQGADAATGKLTALRDAVFGQTANGYQRQRPGPILDTHLAASRDGIARHVVVQQDVYSL